MPTRRENLLAVLAGEEPAWLPVSINCHQWFEHHRRVGDLPATLAAGDYLDALLQLGFDIFSRNHDGGQRSHCALPSDWLEDETPLGTRLTVEQHTPFGVLRRVRQQQRAIATWHDEVYPVQDWGVQGRAVWHALEQTTVDWDEAAFTQVRDRIGDAGIFLVPCAWTPLKQLHHLCGLEGACYAIADHRDEVEAYAAAWWDRCVRPLLGRLATHPRVDAVILMDNVDTPFYPPAIAATLWTPYVREATELLATQGKTCWVHACGKLDGLRSTIAASGVSGLEGIPHPPLGDIDVVDAHAIHPHFIYNGGFGAHEQSADEDSLQNFYAGFLPRAGRRRFIFASACNTAVQTPYERILQVRDLVRQWGGAP